MKQLKIVNFLTIFLSMLYCTPVLGQNSCTISTSTLYSDTVHVVHYDIHLTEVDVTTKTISGYTTISCVPKFNGLMEIKLELAVLTVDSVFQGLEAVNSFLRMDPSLIIPLKTPVNAGDTTELTVYYHGSTFVDPSDWGGFQFAGEYAFNLGVGFDAIPHNLGKAWFPCIDDFRDRALYDVYLTVPNTRKAISGGLLEEVIDNGNMTSTWHWKTGKTLPTYLISAAVGNYVLISDTYNGIEGPVPITFYCRPVDSSKVAGTFSHLKDILQIYETHFGPYPFERVGYTSTAQGAMEHAANIFLPYSGWSGNSNSEWWYAHELSHMWFGDKVTCASAEDMWLNEGWAVWCEDLFLEFLYGPEVSKPYLRSKLNNVIQFSHTIDGGYYPVYGIPQTITYGNTVYEKGAQVTHTLRHYLGDELFFSGIKAYLAAYAYKPASSCDLRDFLSSFTGVDLTDFFEAWVFSPGFPHFSVGYYESHAAASGFDVTVHVGQKLRGRTELANSNHLEITFLGKNWETYTDTLIFSGKQGAKTFHVPFEPVDAIADFNEKISDATMDFSTVIKKTGDVDFPNTYSKVSVTSIADSAFVRISHNWVPPDSLKTPVPGLRISDTRYWKVEGIFPSGFKAKGRFSYNKNVSFDNSLLTLSKDSLILLYRRDALDEWKEVPVTRQGNSSAGALITDSIARGEYTLGAWERYFGMEDHPADRNYQLNIYPNPSRGTCLIELDNPSGAILRVYDSLGKKIDECPFASGKHEMTWQNTSSGSGVYFFRLSSRTGKEIMSRKMIFN